MTKNWNASDLLIKKNDIEGGNKKRLELMSKYFISNIILSSFDKINFMSLQLFVNEACKCNIHDSLFSF